MRRILRKASCPSPRCVLIQPGVEVHLLHLR
jgi:hypothetical protein